MLNILRRRFLGGCSPEKSSMIHLGLVIIEFFHAKCCTKREGQFHVMTFVDIWLKNIIAACIIQTQRYEVLLVGPFHGEKYLMDDLKNPNILFHGNSQLVISNSNLTNDLLVPVRSPGNKANTAVGSDKLIKASRFARWGYLLWEELEYAR